MSKKTLRFKFEVGTKVQIAKDCPTIRMKRGDKGVVVGRVCDSAGPRYKFSYEKPNGDLDWWGVTEDQIEIDPEANAKPIVEPKTEPSTPTDGTPESDTAARIRKHCDELATFLISKNDSYGDSALNPVHIFGNHDAKTLLEARINDKLSRIKNLYAGGSGCGESLKDNIRDLEGYLVLWSLVEGKV